MQYSKSLEDVKILGFIRFVAHIKVCSIWLNIYGFWALTWVMRFEQESNL